MPEITPFRAWRFSSSDSLGALLCPPYDVIGPAQAAELRARSPHNMIHVELPEGGSDEKYQSAAATWREWQSGGGARRDEAAAFYVYAQSFRLPGETEERTRTGFLARLRLSPFEAGEVLPHEQTFPKHKADRLELLRACRAQFSPIFGLYQAGDRASGLALLTRIASGEPAVDLSDDEGVRHRLWVADGPGEIAALQAALRDRAVYIADGHHRYETALRYRDERRAESPLAEEDPWYDGVIIQLVAFEDEGLVCLPTHRLVNGVDATRLEAAASDLETEFDIEEVPASLSAAEYLERARQRGPATFAAVAALGRAALLTLRDPEAMRRAAPERSDAWRGLAVAHLHELVLAKRLGLVTPQAADTGQVGYTRSAEEALSAVHRGEAQAAFLLQPNSVEDVRAVSAAGDRMPQKTTYFWPKLVTGLVVAGEPPSAS